MRITNQLKIYFDSVLFLLFILDYNTMMRSLGSQDWHEISGLVFAGLLIIHMVIDWQWIKYVTLNLFRAGQRFKSRLQYWNDVLLLLMVVYILVSGFGCSSLFPSLNFGSSLFMKHSHKIVSFLALIPLGVHLGLNWKWVFFNVKKLFGMSGTSATGRFIGRAGAIATLALGVYWGTVSGFYTRIFHINEFYDKTFEYPMVGLAKEEFSYNPFYILAVYTAITAVFVILTYYMEQYLTDSEARRR